MMKNDKKCFLELQIKMMIDVTKNNHKVNKRTMIENKFFINDYL